MQRDFQYVPVLLHASSAKGSRLRLVDQLAELDFYVEKNYNSGGVVANESGKDARTAHITLYHDTEHPSALEIPVVRPVVQ